MRIDRSRIKKSTSEVPAECQALIDRLRSCSQKELLEELKKIETWTFGKCELYHWIDILDLCDAILEKAATRVSPKSWQLACDLPGNEEIKELLQWVLYFTTLLIEHSFSRHLYNSVEHLLTLLSSCDLQVVMSVLNLLYMFSKRSNFIARLAPEMRNILLRCLTYLAESWGGKENGFGLAECSNECYCPVSATTVHFEFYADEAAQGTSQISCIHLENVDELDKTPAEVMDGLVEAFKVPKDGQMLLFTHLRLAYSFSDYERRLKCVQARLQALSVLLYSNTFSDSHLLLYPGILDELVELLELNDPALVDIRSAALRTLTSIIHLDRSPHLPKKPGSRLNNIIDVTGAGMYHGFLPQLVRSCISSLTSDSTDTQEQFPLALATALFSFLYHLASYEAGGEALVSCGMMECLLRVINWPGTELEHITFVTRAVRVIDLITNIDMQVFQNHGGLASFINRLEMEIAICRREQPFEILVDAEGTSGDSGLDEELMHITVDSDTSSPSCSKEASSDHSGDISVKANKTCLPQRAALLKSMLNFLKKALQDPAFADSIRHVMDASLPSSLKHIISNAEYYGPSLFLLATDVVAVYVFQEPSLLSSLQDNGLTDVVLHALLVKNVPATREVLGSLPNVFSALCLNTRGLESFVKFCPFDRLFKVLLSPTYLSAMRRRRSSEPIGDTASTLGNAMDELMRHQPSLKVDAISAIIRLLEELCRLGRNPKYICWRPQKGSNNGESPHQTPRSGNEAGSSDEEEDDEEEASTSSHPQREDTSVDQAAAGYHEKTPVALVDYILNVMKFIDAILSNNSTDDHCREFVSQKGLTPLLAILGLPNLPVDYPITPAAQSVASVCKSILNLAHESKVLMEGLIQLSSVLTQLKPLQKSHSNQKGSVLLNELASAACIDTAFSTPLATPMLHAMAAAHGYVVMFVHVCRTGQLDIRTISMTQWGSETGLSVLEGLAELYTALVWESTILLALCSEDVSCDFNKEDIEKLLSPDIKSVDVDVTSETSSGMTAAMEQLNTNLSSEPAEPMEIETLSPGSTSSSARSKSGVTSAIQLKYIKPLLGASSRLGRALAELFGLLVKLCVGFPVRNRRGNHLTSTPISPTPSAQAVASELAALLARGLKFDKLPFSPVPKFRLTYLICSVGFTSPMLFDEKKYPYHLMLQKFVLLKGQKAFFDSFIWALSGGGSFDPDEGLEHPELPEGTGEFLDAWLLLLEKMVNPKAILDSTHVLPTRSTSVGIIKMFDPLKYLQQVHKLAFNAVDYLWGRKPLKTYGERMTDTLLLIYRHILRGEKIIEERKVKELDIVVNNPPEGRRAQGQREHRPEVNTNEMAQLMDMGFSREHCYEALILTSTIEHATDYLLNNFFPQNSQAARFISPIDEEEEEFEPLTKEELDRFSVGALKICLKLLEALPGTVYRVCDLLTTIMRRNGEKFTIDLITGLANVLIDNVSFMTLILEESKLTDEDVIAGLTTSIQAQRVAAIIHLYMLLFEEIRIPCAKVVHISVLLPMLIQLLIQGTGFLELNPNIGTPKWLAPLLLLIDLLEKVSVITNRKANMHKVTTHIWRWFDLTTGKWALYLPLNNKLINDSYWKGDNMLRIVSGRRHYTIMFNQMIQTNEDSGKQRPIMMSLVENRESSTSLGDTREDDDSPSSSPILVTRTETSRATLQANNGDSMEYEPATDFYHRRTGLQGIPGVGIVNASHIVRTCVRLMKIPVDSDTLHAVLQVCVRFTRDYDNAEMAAEMGVVKILLNLMSTTVFSGFLGLATILIRHILEEPGTLYSAMEKVIRAKTLANIPSSYKELHYILRECSAAICRDPETFKAAAKDILRIDVSLLNKRSDEEDTRFLMRSVTNPTGGASVQQNLLRVTVAKSVIYDLLDALIEPDEEDINIHEPPETESSLFMEMQSPLINAAASRRMGEINPVNPVNPDDVTTEQLNRVTSQPFDPSALPVYMALTQPPNTLPTPASSSSSPKSGTNERKLKMLGKAAVLKILGDAVRSYSNVAKMITEFRYKANKSPLVKEECSPVAFVLDHLLSLRERALIDLDVASMARMLIAALASCNHSPDAQAALVAEVKAALGRTLAWPESKKKHYHIQDIVGIVTIMIESCPHVPLCNSPLNSAVKLHQYSANNMVRLMMRKGIATDLARISHSLDLSSPKLSATMNAVLKPLETLSRIMSQPSGVQPGKLKTKPRTPAPSSDEPRTSTSEATHAQGEESVEDADNTDHDVSGTAEIVSEVMNQQIEIMDPDEINDSFCLSRDTEPVADSESNTRTRFNPFEGAGDLSFQRLNNDETIQSSTDDSDSNSSDERIDVDAPTDIDDPEVEEEIEGENEGDETGGAYDEEGLELSESDEGLFHIPGLDPDSDDFLMIEYSDPEAPPQLGPWTANATFPLSFSIFEDPTTLHADNTGSINRIPSQHPLLMTRQNLDSSSGLSSSRAQRLNRTRRYQYVQMNRTSAAPVFLQRLMGQSDQGFSSNGNTNNSDVISTFGSNTRVIVMDNGLGILTNTEEEQINFVDQAGYLLGPSLAATLNNVPTSMHWWNEEGRLLDGESQADCAVVMGHELIPIFEKYRSEECMERKEKRRKHDDTECSKKTDAIDSEKKAFSNDGSVPFPAPTDPDDGYYRVNPPEGYRSTSTPVDMSSASHTTFFTSHHCSLHSSESETPDPLEIETTNWERSTENEGSSENSRDLPLQETASSHSSAETSGEQSTLIIDSSQSLEESEVNSHETISASDTSQNTSEHSSPPSHRPASGSSMNPIDLGSSPRTESQDEEVPEGVDPSFLAALPEDMRAEVVAEQFRLQRLRQQASEVSAAAAGSDTAGAVAGPSGTNHAPVEVNPDFLAALPPNIQEEVLAQQRLEQQRQAASTSNPDEPVDPAAFFQDLPHSLRQAILTDMEESQISALPPELAAEAQNLRREWEARNRQMMQERFLSHVSHSTSALSSILRTTTGRGTRRTPGTRYAIRSLPTASGPRDWAREFGPRHHRLVHNITSVSGQSGSSANPPSLIRSRGRQVLDYESICCLLVLLFVEDTRLNTVRLHRVFRNLCYHAPTRDWVVKALLSIMEKSNVTQTVSKVKETSRPRGGKRMTTRSQVQPDSISFLGNQAQRPPQATWLNISMDAALGCRATVFTVHRCGRRSEKSITINPQAAPFVYRHALDSLISLAKTFPICFTPTKGPTVTPGTLSKLPLRSRHDMSNFWDILIYLDSLSRSKKGKVAARTVNQGSSNEVDSSLEASPFGQLLTMLDAPVICRSPALMDKLLRLLSVISVSLQLNKQPSVSKLETTGDTSKPLSLAVNVLTSSNCSEEGLEDATALLLNMSVNLPSTRDLILCLLLECAQKMASVVCGHIERLLRELRELNSQQNQNDEMEASTSESKGTPLKGVLSNRFTKDIVVVTAPKKVKAGLDLQLSSMAPLICKNSSQSFFLRILKVIVQIRESMKSGDKKDKKEDTHLQEGNENGEISTPMDTSSPVPPRPGRPTCSSPDVFASNDDDDDDDEEDDDESDGNLQQVEQQQSQQQPQVQHEMQPLSEQLNVGELWDTLSDCLTELAHTQDSHAVLMLQPAVEAFFLVHAAGIEKPNTENNYTIQHAVQAGPSTSNGTGQSVSEEFGTPAPPPVSPLPNEPAPDSVAAALATMSYSSVGHDHNWAQNMPPHQQKFLKFAETHRTVLNQILRQCTTPLLEGPFAVLVNHTRVLDFDVKRRYFRSELERADEGHRREELAVHVRRTHVFEDSFRELHRRTPNDWKNRFYIVFEGEEGQDAGGLLREWYMIISREIFNPNYALFTISPGDRVTYTINPSSHCNSNHLSYFKFVGRVIAKAIYDNKLLECYFTRSFYKHILGIRVKYTDMESEDYSFYQGLAFLMDNDVKSLGSELTFSTEVQEFGVTEIRDLIPSGRNMLVTEKNKMDYIRLVCQLKMTGAIRQQLNAFLEGFYDIIPKRLISIFNEQELELLISGLPNVDIDDLKANTEYYKYQPNSLQIQWFWRALREFDQAERAKFLQFVTGTSKVPLQGFAALEGMNGVQKFQIHRDERSTDRLPSAHTCFNQLDLPVYETYTKLRTYLLKAIHECSEGFGFA